MLVPFSASRNPSISCTKTILHPSCPFFLPNHDTPSIRETGEHGTPHHVAGRRRPSPPRALPQLTTRQRDLSTPCSWESRAFGPTRIASIRLARETGEHGTPHHVAGRRRPSPPRALPQLTTRQRDLTDTLFVGITRIDQSA